MLITCLLQRFVHVRVQWVGPGSHELFKREYVNYMGFFFSTAYFEACPSMLDFSGWAYEP